jgi:hypothetical protein
MARYSEKYAELMLCWLTNEFSTECRGSDVWRDFKLFTLGKDEIIAVLHGNVAIVIVNCQGAAVESSFWSRSMSE